ncbi:MAG: DNA polymerase III subunit delta', partial [Sandarakinorhabdus sp.]
LAGAPAGADFTVPPDCEAARLMAAGSHLDFFELVPVGETKSGTKRGEILIPQIARRDKSPARVLRDFMGETAALGRWKVVIIDAAEQLNDNAANAILKMLEEPSENTIFLLVSHLPGRLKPTIRSRCRTLRFSRLADGDVARVLASVELDGEDAGLLIHLAQGCPGRALGLAAAGITALERDLAGLIGQPVERASPAALAPAHSVSLKGREGRYAALLDRAPAMIATRAQQLDGDARAAAITAWEQASRLAREAVPQNLDAGQVAYALGMHVASLAA